MTTLLQEETKPVDNGEPTEVSTEDTPPESTEESTEETTE